MMRLSERVLGWRAWCAASVPLCVALCGAAPPEEGLEVRGAGGVGNYEYTTGGCGTTSYTNKAREAKLYGQVSYRTSSGASVALESNVATGRVYAEELFDDVPDTERPPSEVGKRRTLGSIALRPGFHARYGGIEAGATYLTNNLLYGDGGGGVFTFSGRAWAGVPRYAYAWLDVLSGPASFGYFPATAGVGHASERLRLELGVLNVAGAFSVSGQYRVLPFAWMGAMAHTTLDGADFGGMLMLSLPLDPLMRQDRDTNE